MKNQQNPKYLWGGDGERWTLGEDGKYTMDSTRMDCPHKSTLEELIRTGNSQSLSKVSTPSDGGPAFPHDGQANYTGGMTLRDYFAGQALAGLISAGAKSETPAIVLSEWAYHHANRMIQERNKSNGT